MEAKFLRAPRVWIPLLIAAFLLWTGIFLIVLPQGGPKGI